MLTRPRKGHRLACGDLQWYNCICCHMERTVRALAGAGSLPDYRICVLKRSVCDISLGVHSHCNPLEPSGYLKLGHISTLATPIRRPEVFGDGGRPVDFGADRVRAVGRGRGAQQYDEAEWVFPCVPQEGQLGSRRLCLMVRALRRTTVQDLFLLCQDGGAPRVVVSYCFCTILSGHHDIGAPRSKARMDSVGAQAVRQFDGSESSAFAGGLCSGRQMADGGTGTGWNTVIV